MTYKGWVFLTFSWGIVGLLVVYSFYKIFRSGD